VGQARGVGEIPPPDPDALLRQPLRLFRVADAHSDLLGRNASEQLLHDRPAELTVGSGDDNQDGPPPGGIIDNCFDVSITNDEMLTEFCYRH
jgi:hypothetical protein